MVGGQGEDDADQEEDEDGEDDNEDVEAGAVVSDDDEEENSDAEEAEIWKVRLMFNSEVSFSRVLSGDEVFYAEGRRRRR